MPTAQTFAVVGGDLRQIHLAGLLAAQGRQVLAVGFDRDVEIPPMVRPLRSAADAVVHSDCVVLPLPYSVDGVTVNAPFAHAALPLSEIWDSTREGQLITGGRLDSAAREAARVHRFRAVDYYEREELAILNSIPTAEGAIQIAMEELPVTIHGARCLVLGYGRVGRYLAHDLKALGADVSVCARKHSDLAWVRAMGGHGIHTAELPEHIARFDAVFNTVPATLLTEQLLTRLSGDCLVIDLASKPGGVDFETAGRLGVKAIWALSLPGKVAPLTAGAIICDTVLHIVDEEDAAQKDGIKSHGKQAPAFPLSGKRMSDES